MSFLYKIGYTLVSLLLISLLLSCTTEVPETQSTPITTHPPQTTDVPVSTTETPAITESEKPPNKEAVETIGTPDSTLIMPSVETPAEPEEDVTVLPPPELPDFTSDIYEKHPYQDIVNAVRFLQPTNIPEHLSRGSGNRTFDEFDVNEYFSVLSNVSVKQGYTLDYVYMGDFMGGRPIIYVRELSQQPYVSFTELLVGEGFEEEFDDPFVYLEVLMQGGCLEWPASIIVNDTPEGYFEFLVLSIMGGQFYLWWHANYDDIIFICDCSALQNVVEECEGFGLPLPVESVISASELDLSPRVEIMEDVVYITAVFFTKWGGFLQGTFQISREFPHSLINAEWEVLIEYECGVMF